MVTRRSEYRARGSPLQPALWCLHGMKTLIIAEKPSVGRDLAGALAGPFQNRTLEDLKPRAKKAARTTRPSSSPTTTSITWAVGHLVELVEPEEYDEKFKKWRMADLPIVPPDGFKLVPRDAKSKKQLKLIEKLLAARRRRPDHQRVRRRPRGRADLRLHLRGRLRRVADRSERPEAGRAPLDQLDDEAGDPRRLREACAPATSWSRSRPPRAPAPRPTGSSA